MGPRALLPNGLLNSRQDGQQDKVDVRTGPPGNYSPVMASLGIPLGKIPMSNSGVMTPSMFPNMEDRPRVNNIPKKSTDHTGAPGMCRTASVKTMKARPGPEALCNTKSVLWTYTQHTPHIITCTHPIL